MAFLYNSKVRKILLILILAWGVVSFYLQNIGNLPILILTGLISLFALYTIFKENSAVFILIFLSFMTAFAFYAALYQLSLPLWFVMLGILILFGYLFTFTEQKIGILGNKRLIYLLLFSIIILEVFLSLSYFLINPIGQSLIIAAISYLLIGFCYTILAKHADNKFSTYAVITAFTIAAIFLTSKWTGLV